MLTDTLLNLLQSNEMSPLEATGQSGRFIDNADMRNRLDLSFCIHAELISFSGGGEAGEESKKNDRQIKISHPVGALGASLSR